MVTTRGARLVRAYVERNPIYETSWAVVVGINEYSADQGRLANAVNDAQAVAQVLSETHRFDEVHTLYDQAATRSNITGWLRDELPSRTREHDRVIFFFAGHGVTQQGIRGSTRGYLVPVDAKDGKYADYIDMHDLLRACPTFSAKHILFILDCCFSGVAAVAANRSMRPDTPTQLNDAYLRRITEQHAWQILTAGATDDRVADGGLRPGHSIFTSALLDGLAGAADHNGDGLMTLTDLAAYVKPIVTRESEVLIGRGQLPFANYLVGSGQGEFAFLLPVPEEEEEATEYNSDVATSDGQRRGPEIIVPPQPKLVRPIDFTWITIPAGTFLMGSDKRKDPQARYDELPQHEIYLDTYRIARTPVTNVQYKQFVDATKHTVPPHWENGNMPTGKENHPVVYVNWHDAMAFCAWAKVRLPSEAEWEKAASWDAEQKVKRIYPWGDKFDAARCNSRAADIRDTTPVDRYLNGAGPYGVLDMAGNVWEWTADWYNADYYKHSPKEKPTGPEEGSSRTLRGGSWLNYNNGVRCAVRNRNDPNYVSDLRFGFRVVESSPGF